MSYSRETGTPNFIYFYYEKQGMFNNISIRTLYRARTLKSEGGDSLIDEYAMTEDEEDAFLVFIRDAVTDAFNVVIKQTTGIDTDAVFYDKTIITNPGAIDRTNVYGFKIVDYDAFNENTLYTVDDGVKRYVQYHIMAAWYELVGLTEEHAKWVAKRDDMRRDLLTTRLFQLKKPLIETY